MSDRGRQILYDLTSIGHLKNQTHKYREKIGSCQRQGERWVKWMKKEIMNKRKRRGREKGGKGERE